MTKCLFVEHLVSHSLPPLSEHDQLKYMVFKDLWESGLYLTNGFKFSCDFLVYEGDPINYHAKYMLIIKRQTDEMRSIEALIKGRLSVQVAKQLLVATINLANEVEYATLSWKGRVSRKDKE